MEGSNSSQSPPTAEQIISALDRTGFIFEHRVSQEFRKLDFITFLNDAFEDSETGKSREVDVIATTHNNVKRENELCIIVDATLVIECKNYTDPLIIIGQRDDVGRSHAHPVISFDPLALKFALRDPEEYGGLYAELALWKLPSHNTKGFIGSQLVKMRRQGGNWQATNDSIYDSIIYPLAKAIEAETAAASRLDPKSPPWYLPTVAYCLPVLVTSGAIFTVDVIEDETPEVSAAQWAPVVRNFSDKSLMVDVVRYDAIEEYVRQRVFPILAEANNALASHLEFFDPAWLKRRYGDSSDPIFTTWLEAFLTPTEAE